MEKEKKKTPVLRFPTFTEDWEQRKLPEFVEFFNGLTYTPDDVRESGTLVLRSSNVKNGEIVDADNVYVDPEKATSEQVKAGDIIVVVRNGSRTLIGKHAEIKGEKPNTVIGAFMSGIRSKHPSFVNALLDTSQFEKEIEKNMGATINQITGYMFSKMEFLIPSLEEQKMIGDYFNNLDNLITLHQQQLDDIKEYKKGLLQKMFPKKGEKTPELRLPGFTDDWEQRKLGEITEFVTGKSFSSELSDDGKYIVMDMGTVSQEGIRIETKRSDTERDILQKDDLIMPKDDIGGGLIIGRTAHIPCDNKYVLGDHVYRLRFDNEDGLFVHYQINSDHIRRQIMPLVTGSAQLGLNSKNVNGVSICVPSYNEQKQIGHLFSGLDDTITLYQQQIDDMKEYKKGLLQKMFPN